MCTKASANTQKNHIKRANARAFFMLFAHCAQYL